MTDSYYNTTNARGSELRQRERNAGNQEERIMAFFDTASGFLYTPSQIREYVFENKVPLTSVRRAMTNLTDKKRLYKTDKKRKGPYGHPEHCWRRRIGKPSQGELSL